MASFPSPAGALVVSAVVCAVGGHEDELAQARVLAGRWLSEAERLREDQPLFASLLAERTLQPVLAEMASRFEHVEFGVEQPHEKFARCGQGFSAYVPWGAHQRVCLCERSIGGEVPAHLTAQTMVHEVTHLITPSESTASFVELAVVIAAGSFPEASAWILSSPPHVSFWRQLLETVHPSEPRLDGLPDSARVLVEPEAVERAKLAPWTASRDQSRDGPWHCSVSVAQRLPKTNRRLELGLATQEIGARGVRLVFGGEKGRSATINCMKYEALTQIPILLDDFNRIYNPSVKIVVDRRGEGG